MENWKVVISDEEIDEALERSKNQQPRPNAVTAVYDARFDLIILVLDTGARLTIPREQLQDLQQAHPAQLSEIEIHSGVNIAWPQLDVDLYLPYLLEGRYGSTEWMQSLQRKMTAA